ncbi:MAG: DUF3536 domain-containing protein [Cyanobacteria bacterium P01_D01_bin.36]
MVKPQSIPASISAVEIPSDQHSQQNSEQRQPTATGTYICVHGHFYQPPRENPFLDVVSRQPSAAPFHDWNERILHESYRPNAFARILNDRGEVVSIVNNYEHISFNIGPTLMSWLERHDIETYQRIIEADRRSCERNQGHGNAIAQVYNHIIMPLANHRDKETQVRWGIADFKRRFGRDPEGMWLAETAVDNATLEVLANEGIQFIVLAPSQASRCRRFGLAEGFDEWRDVNAGDIDPTRPYRCFLPEQPNGRNYIDIFFYDGPISGDMGFDDILRSSQHFADRLSYAVRPWPPKQAEHPPAQAADSNGAAQSQIVSVATDGETFGHHRKGAEKALAYALIHEFPARGWQVTSYAHYLSLCPPTWEVQLKPVTAWSCSHGVERWKSDCGCGGGGGWQQQWRAPLRETLDWLRDHLVPLYEDAAKTLLSDPWAARNDYVAVISDRAGYSSGHTLDAFFNQHQAYPLNPAERTDVLRLLEMQRHALLMYTSCGWFFDEISRPEGTQILRYASRAIELARTVSGIDLEPEFIGRLEHAPSNVEYFKDGAGVYLKQVQPNHVSLEQVVAHYAMGSLFNQYRREHQLYCYTLERQDYYQQPLGALTLAVGQVKVTSAMTQETTALAFAVLHLGGWDFHCGVQSFPSPLAYNKAKSAVIDAFTSNSIAQSVLSVTRYFSPTYTLKDLFAEERQQIMQQLNQETLQRLDQLYEQVYRENYGILMAFHRDHIDVPQALQVAADITLSHRALDVIRALEQDIVEPDGNLLNITVGRIAELEGIAAEAHHFRCQLKLPGAQEILERLIVQGLSQTLQTNPINVMSDVSDDMPNQATDRTTTDRTTVDNNSLENSVAGLERLSALGPKLALPLSLYKAQELYYSYLVAARAKESQGGEANLYRIQMMPYWACLKRLGQTLTMDVASIWFA